MNRKLIICERCGKPERRSGYTFYCWECADRLRRDRAAFTSIAHRAVKKAIARGDLKPIQRHTCVDCDSPAEVYDHRDYRFPLAVEPVCQGCNARRGPGLPYQGRRKIKRQPEASI